MAVAAGKGLASTVAWRYVPHVPSAAEEIKLRTDAWAATPEARRVLYAKTLLSLVTNHASDPRVAALLVDPTPWGLEALMALSTHPNQKGAKP